MFNLSCLSSWQRRGVSSDSILRTAYWLCVKVLCFYSLVCHKSPFLIFIVKYGHVWVFHQWDVKQKPSVLLSELTTSFLRTLLCGFNLVSNQDRDALRYLGSWSSQLWACQNSWVSVELSSPPVTYKHICASLHM